MTGTPRCPVEDDLIDVERGGVARFVCGEPLVRASDGPCVGGIWSDRVLFAFCGAERDTAIHEVLYEFGGHPYQPPLVCPIHPPLPDPTPATTGERQP